MPAANDGSFDLMERWLASGGTARISGFDVRPVPHPLLPETVQSVTKGQASVFFLRQEPHGNIWLLKKFSPSKSPSHEYLKAIHRYLPAGPEFFSCTQRRILTVHHVDWRHSEFKSSEFVSWIEGAIFMPKVPGASWSSIADSLRGGESSMTLTRRLRAAVSLTKSVARLEAAGCSHRDISGHNVYIAPDDRTQLIDHDSFFHPELPFQSNTTLGTPGYIAPFLHAPAGSWNARLSWRPLADRFPMAVLVAEFLLVGPEHPETHEDGALFSQAHFDDPDHPFMREQVAAIAEKSRACASLFERTIRATSFGECPSPDEWRSALRHDMRLREAQVKKAQARSPLGHRVRQTCARCGRTTWIDEERHHELEVRGKDILCNSCLGGHLRERSNFRRQLDSLCPQLACEHCSKAIRIPKPKLEALRMQGRPILCRACLESQLSRWREERDAYLRDRPETTCAQCGKPFRMTKHKVALLRARGKSPLCRECLRKALSSQGPRLTKDQETVRPRRRSLNAALRSLLGI